MKETYLKKRALTARQVEELYGIATGTLANWRMKCHGPKHYKCGRKVFYFIEDVELWIKRNPILTDDCIEHINNFRHEK